MTKYFKKFMNKKEYYSNPKNLTNLFLGLVTMVIITISSACEQDPSSLGSNLLPDNIDYHYDTTLSFIGNVYEEEPYSTYNLTNYSIGVLDDAYFGLFKASYAGQFLPTTYYTKDSTVTTFEVDSLTMFIAVDSIYGFHDGGLKFNVYELNKEIEDEYDSDVDLSTYYSAENLISTGSGFSGDTLIVIRLSSDFASKLIPTDPEDTTYKNVTNFLSAYNGIAIIPELVSSNGEVVKIDFSSEDTEMLMYYNDSSEFSYSLGKTTIKKFASYTNDFTGSGAEEYITNDTTINDELIFLQGISGLSSTISFTNIDTWLVDDSAYSVIGAELYIPVYKDEDFETLYPPAKLYMRYEYEEGSYSFISDYYDFLNGRGVFDGNYDEENGYYRFLIPRHLMQILNREIDGYTIDLSVVNKSIFPHRVILQSGENIKIKVTYTKH
ncbi:MAG: hypothetical protein C0597_13835 [Marinilabiliales bacterium]|nr:MAG: hypothetical protein C0597_13835 [Marinilabiliales bacterium]